MNIVCEMREMKKEEEVEEHPILFVKSEVFFKEFVSMKKK